MSLCLHRCCAAPTLEIQLASCRWASLCIRNMKFGRKFMCERSFPGQSGKKNRLHGLKVEDVFIRMSGLHPSGCCGNCGIRVQLFVCPPFLRTARTGVLVWRVSPNVRLSCTMMSSTHSRCCSSTSPRPSIHPSAPPPPPVSSYLD